MSSKGDLQVDLRNNISTITFYHPKANSLTSAMLRELAQIISDKAADESTGVIVLQSKGEGTFCGGASFDELAQISNHKEGKYFFMGFAEVINAMRKCPKLIIARIQGKAVGGGIGIVAATDYALAHHSADIKLSELSLGIGPFVVEPAICRKIGNANFSTLAIDATNWYDAQWAYHRGLYAHVLETHHKLDKKIEELATKLSRVNPSAMRELKKIIWKGTDHWDTLLEQQAEISSRLALSDYTKNSINKFKNKK